MRREHRSHTTPRIRPASRKSDASRYLARVLRHRSGVGVADGWLAGCFIRNDIHRNHHRRHRALNRLADAAGRSDVDGLCLRARLPLQRHRDACAGDHRVGICAGCAQAHHLPEGETRRATSYRPASPGRFVDDTISVSRASSQGAPRYSRICSISVALACHATS
jgi:hypothetical protein